MHMSDSGSCWCIAVLVDPCIGEYNFFAGRLLQSSHPTKSHSCDGQICMANSSTTCEPVLVFIEFLSVLSVRHGNATGQSSLCILCGG